MSKPIKRLGRGLDSLVSRVTFTEPASAGAGPKSSDGSAIADSADSGPKVEAAMVATDALRPNPFQPRSQVHEEEVASLADSIRRSGILQPIAVRRKHGGYEIIAGERRWSAAKANGMSEVPVIVRTATDEQMLELALVENIQREDLNAIDRASAYREFCTRFSVKPEELAERLGEDRTTVTNYLRILDLPKGVRDLVAGDKLSMGHARCLLSITDDRQRMQMAESVVGNELSVRALEEIVRREKTRRQTTDGDTATRVVAMPPHVLDLQRRFEQAVKTKVVIREGKRKGTGRIIIEYFSLDDFDRIAAMLSVSDE